MRIIRRDAMTATVIATLIVLACSTGEVVDPDAERTWAAVAPRSDIIDAIGSSRQLSVVDAFAVPIDGVALEWTSLDAGVVSVSAQGLVTATGPGEARVVVREGARTDTARITVSQRVESVTVSPAASTLTVGETVQLGATLRDANGHLIQGRSIAWSSSHPSIASVSGTGLVTGLAAGSATLSATSGGRAGTASLTVNAAPTPPPPPPPPTTAPDTVFADGFESGTLAAWEDGVNTSQHRVITSSTRAHSGTRLLEVTYPAGGDGGWLTRFFMPGYDSLYVRMWVRFPDAWTGTTKLLLLRGSRTDNQWSSFGVAGKCPSGTNFFATNLIADTDQRLATFYTYYLGMPREPDGVTCWGRFSATGSTQYFEPRSLSKGVWHRVEFFVKLDTPAGSEGEQHMWVDGVLKGSWTGLDFRTTTDLRLNSMTLELSAHPTSGTRILEIDDILVLRGRPPQ